MDNRFGADRARDGLLLIGRILLMLLFVIFGWEKLIGFAGTVGYFAHMGLPEPTVAAVIAVVMEFFVGVAITAGIFTRPLAILIAIYTVATALIGHHFWTMSGMPRVENEINFFKNMSITGGLILLYVTGAGRYSVDTILMREG